MEAMARSWSSDMGRLARASTLCCLEYVDVLGDAVRHGVESQHVGWEVDQFAGVEAATVVVDVREELFGRDVRV